MKHTILLLLLITNCTYGYINRVFLNMNYIKHDMHDICELKMISDIPNTQRRDLLLYGTSIIGVANLYEKINSPIIYSKNIERFQNKIYNEVSPSVCYISTEYGNVADKYNIDKDDLPKGVGTGFIWDQKGHIITNFHVINKVDNAIVTITDKNNNKKEYRAKLTGIDPDNDLAVLKIELDNNDEKLRVIKYKANVNVNIGDFAFAIGNPFGQDHTLTSGIISGINREIKAPTGRKIYGIIQTDAAINPGNSGGPLLNSNCEIIGINTASLGMGVSAGIGFAIPIKIAAKSIKDIIDTGFVNKAILGITYMERNPSILESEKSGIPIIEKGVLILEVPPDSPAFEAGLRGIVRNKLTNKIEKIGDIIISIDGKNIENPSNLNEILKLYKPDDVVMIKYSRDNIIKEAIIKLGSYRGAAFTQLENERGKDFLEKSGKNELNIPLKNLEPKIDPKLN